MKIYIKQPNERPIPVTVRIEWLPNGKIKPLMYWTPDNSCYVIKHIYESTLLAFLKEKGEGIRFRVKAEIEGAPNYMDYARHEVYLYIVDNRFCAKNFIDGRYANPLKEYIPVVLDVFPDAEYELVSFRVGQNCYMVEDTLDVEFRSSYKIAGMGIWHKVRVRMMDEECCHASLVWEMDKWLIYKKASAG